METEKEFFKWRNKSSTMLSREELLKIIVWLDKEVLRMRESHKNEIHNLFGIHH